MNDRSAKQRAEYNRMISARESQLDGDLNTLRKLDEQWESYQREMRENFERFKEAGHALGTGNYRVQRDLAALKEVVGFAERLTKQQNEIRAEATRVVHAGAEAEVERLRNERNKLPWD
jgi:hypothetical protein